MSVGTGYSESYSYDSFKRAQSVTRTIDGRNYTTSYQFHTANQVTQMTYPSNRVLNIGHDSKGRVTSVGSYLSSVTYDGIGRVTGTTLGNGVTEGYGYDANRMQLTSQTGTKSGGPANGLMNLTYGYQATAGQMGAGSTGGNAGQLMSISGTIGAVTESAAYIYDNLGRLVTSNQTSNGSTAQRRFAFDRWGNRTGMWDAVSGGNQIQSITLQQSSGVPTNRIASVTAGSTVNYVYDAAGNVINDGAHSFTYDSENRIVSVDGGSTATYAYDQSNQRYKKTVGSTVTHYIWQGSQVIAEHNGSTGALIVDYIYSRNRMIAKVTGGLPLTNYVLSDRLSVRLMLNVSGNVVGRQGHLPFGDNFAESGAQEKHHFTSYERDGEDGFDYAVNRHYTQSVGRFIQVDPYSGSARMDAPQSWNRYSYAHNEPVDQIDPLGLDSGNPEYCGPWRQDCDHIIPQPGFSMILDAHMPYQPGAGVYDGRPISDWHPEPRPSQPNPCADRYRRFFGNIGLYRNMAIQLRTEVVFLVALSAYESGWLDNHNFGLHNLFGVTNAGRNNLRYRSFQAAADDWIRRFGQYVSGTETMQQFIEGLRKVPPNGYNNVNPDYDNTLRSMVNTVERIAERCGIDLTTPLGPPS